MMDRNGLRFLVGPRPRAQWRTRMTSQSIFLHVTAHLILRPRSQRIDADQSAFFDHPRTRGRGIGPVIDPLIQQSNPTSVWLRLTNL